MTAHEVFTSLFWLVAAGYVGYVAWFVWQELAERRTRRRSDLRR